MLTNRQRQWYRYYDILSEIRSMRDIINMVYNPSLRTIKSYLWWSKQYDFSKEETFDNFHNKFNLLCKEIKQLNIEPNNADERTIRELSSTLLNKCSMQYKMEWFKRNK